MAGPASYMFRPETAPQMEAPEGTNPNDMPSLVLGGSTKDTLLAAGKEVFFPIAPAVAELTFNFKF